LLYLRHITTKGDKMKSLTMKEVLKEARGLAKNLGYTLKTQYATINGKQAYKIVNRTTGITKISNMTLVSAWETLLDGRFAE